MNLYRIIGSVGLGSLISLNALAVPSEDLINQYNQASAGDSSLVEPVYEHLQKQVEQGDKDGLTLVYLGSTRTMMGREAWMPWNKMRYTEEGLDIIARGLSRVNARDEPVSDQTIRQGMPESLLAQAIAASTFTSLPSMFNHFDRGYDLFLTLLVDPDFESVPFNTASWVYVYAIKAAVRADDEAQADVWLGIMKQQDASHPDTLEASGLVNDTQR